MCIESPVTLASSLLLSLFFFSFDITTSILLAIIVIILTIFATLIIVIAIDPEVWVHAFTCARRARLAIRFDGVARLRVGFRV